MASAPSVVGQHGFRFRNDNGSETAATWKAALNTNVSHAADQKFRLRIYLAIDAQMDFSASVDARLQYSRNGGVYTNVAAQGAASPVRFADSSGIADDEATTRQITVGGTFKGGRCDENGATTALSMFAGGDVAEFEFALEFVGAQVAVGDTFDFRITRSGIALNSYSQIPRATVQATITGTLAVTEAAKDTAAFAGGIRATGALAATSAKDSAHFSSGLRGTLFGPRYFGPRYFGPRYWGTVPASITGLIAATEAAKDSAAFAGGIVATGTLVASEAAKDAAAFTGTAKTEGTLVASEAADAAAFAGAVAHAAVLAATEAADAAAFTGTLVTTGTLAATEARDTAAFAGAIRATGTLVATEAKDSAVFAGEGAAIVATGELVAVEAADAAAFAGTVPLAAITGTLAATEAADIAAFTGFALGIVVGVLDADEASDVAAFFETVADFGIDIVGDEDLHPIIGTECPRPFITGRATAPRIEGHG